MKKFYKLTLRTRDIFNFTTAVVIKQYDPNPEIIAHYSSADGQLTDVKIHCTVNEKVVISMALSDYILRIKEIDVNNKEINFAEKFYRGWL